MVLTRNDFKKNALMKDQDFLEQKIMDFSVLFFFFKGKKKGKKKVCSLHSLVHRCMLFLGNIVVV